jgi:CAAX protease family protein
MGLGENNKEAVESTESHKLLERHKKLLKIRDLKLEDLKLELSEFHITMEMRLILLLYAITIVFAEFVIISFEPAWSILFLVVIIISLIILSSLSSSDKFSYLLQALILIPLLRIMSLSLPGTEIEPIYWLVITILPLTASCLFLMRGQSLSSTDIGLNIKNLPVQLLVVWGGLAIGFIGYLILEPPAIISNLNTIDVVVSTIILISVGFTVELIFRGIIQKNADKIVGEFWGLLFVSVLFTSQYIAWNSVPYLTFVFGVSIIYGYIFQKTNSISGVGLSHGIANVMFFLILPLSQM